MRSAHRSLAFVAAALLVGIAADSGAQVPDSYSGLSPLIGDFHQHTMSPQDARALAGAIPNSPGYCTGNMGTRHEFGFPPLVLDNARSHGYDWTNLSPHTMAGMTENQNDAGYSWWISSTSPINYPPPYTTSDPSAILDVYFIPGSNPLTHYLFHRSTAGFPFYKANDPNFLNLGGLSVPWSYWLSNGSAADSRNVPNSYVAFAGTEYTNPGDFPGASGATGAGGHRLVVIPSAVRGCSVDSNNVSSATYCDDEYEVDRWIVKNGGLAVQAHPSQTPPMPTLHPKNAPAGFSESVIVGMEVGGGFQGFTGAFFESSIRSAMTAGYRVFPSWGSDDHNGNDPYCGGPWAFGTDLQRGGTICWAPTFDRSGLVGAMKARRCYFSNGYKPTLKLEACSNASCTGGVAKMGDKLTLSDPNVYVRLSVSNDTRNQAVGVDKRLDRFEIVHQNGQVLLGQACTRGTSGAADTCNLPFTRITLPAASGGFYARVCTLVGGRTTCDDNGVVPSFRAGSTPTQIVSAPVFVNWDQYRTSLPKRFCDFDASSIPCGTPGCLPANVDSDQDGWPDVAPNICDTCPSLYDPTQADADKNGIGDLCNNAFDSDGDEFEDAYDNCPTVANPTQADTDHSGIGDACNSAFDSDGDEWENFLDNCPNVANPTQADMDGDHIGDACDPDIDGDGVPNGSDNCPNVPNPDQANADGDQWGDACDNCKFVQNNDQADSDMDWTFAGGLVARPDGVGDACDNCVKVYNPVPTVALLPNQTTTGGQIDDDADGYGNACDLDYDNDGVVYALPEPINGVCGEEDDFWAQVESGISASANTCGRSGNLRCELFDMNGDGVLSASDEETETALSFTSGGTLIGTKCPGCPLTCAPSTSDACNPPDSDGDGRKNGFDNCPSVPNANQADGDGDGVGDVCDSCISVVNRRVPAGCFAMMPWMTTTGGQRDDDHDGYGNVCDAKFTTSGTGVGPSDLASFRASLNKDRTLDTCGTTGNRPCAIYDLDEVNDFIDANDQTKFSSLNGKVPGPKCTTCPLTCVAGAQGSCN